MCIRDSFSLFAQKTHFFSAVPKQKNVSTFHTLKKVDWKSSLYTETKWSHVVHVLKGLIFIFGISANWREKESSQTLKMLIGWSKSLFPLSEIFRAYFFFHCSLQIWYAKKHFLSHAKPFLVFRHWKKPPEKISFSPKMSLSRKPKNSEFDWSRFNLWKNK